MQGFARVGSAIPAVRVAGLANNCERTLKLFERAHHDGLHVVTFPELGLVGYTARDLLLDRTLLEGALEALGEVIAASAQLAPLALVGLPLRTHVGVYNVAAAVQGGRLLGIVPKSYLPNYREFEERRWFRPGTEVGDGSLLRLFGEEVPFGTDLLFASTLPGLTVGVEICEDMFVQTPPSAALTSAGATVICNLSASNFLVGKAEQRKLLAAASSDRGKCAYVYVAAGPSESSTDVAFDAHTFIYEAGWLLAESKRFSREDQLLSADVDLESLEHERSLLGTFGDCASANPRAFRSMDFESQPLEALQRTFAPHPFVPKDPATLAARCWETFEIQTNALATRLSNVGAEQKLVLGLSGGLDSTHAALVCANALDLIGRPRSDLVCLTMPGFGSTADTQSNAEQLAHALHATFQRVEISELSREVLEAFGHPAGAGTVDELLARIRKDKALADLAFENVQARMRTLLLMSVANRERGIVVGTGDLSEKALGWSTYAGDQISMYDVNAGVPKTLIQFLIRWVANERITTWTDSDPAQLRQLLFAVLETPISPELLPPDEQGKIAQLTETALGPYELHDFYLYHFVRHARRPLRILGLAEGAFAGRYDRATLRRWLELFLRRFFFNQFKRSCTPDGPKVGSVALSPRGDWRMPSDADVSAWLSELASG
ncbi:MAG TPA: NAD(+) synthase [Polyangiales bacterium]|nr:NAD(+) synthase [Polyangiales bacterium]